MKAREFIEGNILPFRTKDIRSDDQKYNDALENQTGIRSDLGTIPCPYCDNVWCNFDCDEALAGDAKTNDVDETSAVGIITKQNTTADVGPDTLNQNIRKLFPNLKKKAKKDKN